MNDRLFDLTKPDKESLEMTTDGLNQPVSWDGQNDRSVSFAEYICGRFPQLAKDLGLEMGDIVVKPISELTQEELRKVTAARIQSSTTSEQMVFAGHRVMSMEELRLGVLSGSQQELVFAAQVNIIYLELMAEAGKIHRSSI